MVLELSSVRNCECKGELIWITQNLQRSSFIKVMPKNVSISTQEIARALLTPGELGQFPSDQEIVLVAGLPPIRARKVRYYQDENFKKRLCGAPNSSDVIYEPKEDVPILAHPQFKESMKSTTTTTSVNDDFYGSGGMDIEDDYA